MLLTICMLMNLIGLFAMALDKFLAIKHMWRISEFKLLLLAAMGGSIGIWIGMYLFRHKTKRLKFVIGTPVILLFQTVIICYYFKNEISCVLFLG